MSNCLKSHAAAQMSSFLKDSNHTLHMVNVAMTEKKGDSTFYYHTSYRQRKQGTIGTKYVKRQTKSQPIIHTEANYVNTTS